MSVEKITDNIFANVAYEGGNVSCINTKEGVILVDTPPFRKDIEDWKAFVLGLNPKGIRYIINTHIHFDHIIGNHKLGGTVIMHEKTGERLFDKGATLREAMAGMMPGWPKEEVDFILSEPLTPPGITMSKELNMYMGDYTLKLRHIGGHTADSITVYVVEDQILISGDNITAARHPYKGEACFSEWIKALQEMKTYDIKTIIPGHGEVCKKEEIDRFLEYFQTLWNKTNDLVVKDSSREDVVNTLREEMFDFFEVEPEMLEGAKMMFDMGTSQLYKEIKSG